EGPVDGETDEDDVGATPALRGVDEVAETAGGVDLLGDDDDEPAAHEREPESDEEAGQRGGEQHATDDSEPSDAEGGCCFDVAGGSRPAPGRGSCGGWGRAW